jgi:transcriptional regulator with XRE-family HTH domain
MTTQVDFEKRLQDERFARVFFEESLVIDVLEEVCGLMAREGVSRAELARRLGTARANVTQMLNGRNVTLRTLAAAVHALGGEIKFHLKASSKGDHPVGTEHGTVYPLRFAAHRTNRLPITIYEKDMPTADENAIDRKVVG